MASADDPVVQRLLGGDAQALGEFLESRRPQLLAHIERGLGAGLRRKVEAQDIFQEVAVYALRALAGAELKGRDPFGWLCQVADQRIIDAHRRFFDAKKRAAGREVDLDAPARGGHEADAAGLAELLAVSMTTPSQAFSRDQREYRLAQAVAALPEVQREALRLRYGEGLASKEIAQRLGKTDGAVRVLLTRAVQHLQEVLREDSAGGAGERPA